MVILLVIINWLLPLLYLALLIDYGATFFIRTKAQARNPWLIPVLCVHGIFLVLQAIHQGRPPLAGVYEILSVLALSTAAVYAVVEFAGRDRRTGVFVFLLVFLFQYTSSSFLASGMASAPSVQLARESGGWARLHIVPALVAYTACAIAVIYGLLHILAQRTLKQHRFGLLFDRLPPLDLLGHMTWYALLSGFVFITITIVTGLLFGHFGAGGQAGVPEAKVAAKIIIGSITWLIYLAAVLGKFLAKWPASRIAGIAVAGFVVAMALFVVSGILS